MAKITLLSWRRRIPRWAWVVILAVLLLIILLLLMRRRQAVSVTPVVVGQAITAVYAPGTVLSGTQTTIPSTAAARIVALYIDRGNTVVPGQIVARLDDRQARLQLQAAQSDLQTAQAQLTQTAEAGDPYAIQQARAELAQAQSDYRRALSATSAAQAGLRNARAQVSQAQAGVRTALARASTARRNVQTLRQQRSVAEEQVGVARAQVSAAEATLADAQDALTRQRALFAQGAVAERRVVEAQTAVRSAEANLAQMRANVAAAQQQVTQVEAEIDASQSQVDEAENSVDQARATLSQSQTAIESAQAQIAEANAQAQTAREQINAAQAHLAQTRRGERSSAVVVSQTKVQAAADRVAQSQDALNDYTVRSLVSGTVSDVLVDVGDFVQLGGTIADVVGQRELYVQADVDETDIAPIRIGQTAYFTTDSIPDRSFQGVVTQIGASANETTNTYPVEIRNIVDPRGLRVNLSVDVNIVTHTNPAALLIPASAVVSTPRPHVWVLGAGSRLHRRQVSIGARDTESGRVEVTSGLVPGERVVTNPQASFRENQTVLVR